MTDKIFVPQYVTHNWDYDDDDIRDAFSKGAIRETFEIEREDGYKIIIEIDDPRSVSYFSPKSMYTDEEWAKFDLEPDAEGVTMRRCDPNNLSPAQEAFLDASMRDFEGSISRG